MKGIVIAGAAALVLLCGCTQSTDGAAESASSSGPSASPTSAAEPTGAPTTTVTSRSTEPSMPDMPAFGVVETTRRALEPEAVTCEVQRPPAGAGDVVYSVSGPDAPRITIVLPKGWTSEAAQDNSMLSMTGPDGLTGSLTVTPTELDPAEAFEKYADQVTAGAPISSVSVLPGDLCGYSGQKLMGMLSGGNGGAVEYQDRIAHIWTAGPSYLVAIHVEGPQGGDAVSAAAELILADFGVQIP